MSKKDLSESDICDQFITPAITAAGWDKTTQIRREYAFTDGRVIVRGKVAARGAKKQADYLLFFQANLAIAIVEAKNNEHPVGGGIQQALAYAEPLDVPFVFSSNGDGFVFHDRTGLANPVERNLKLEEFPSPAQLWEKYRAWKGLADDTEKVARIPYHDDGNGKEPRYYQRIAIQRTVEAVTRGQRRALLVMATGTHIPVAPLAEQRRMVARVAQLMTLLDRLEARLRETRDTQAAFAAAAVHNLDD